MKKNWRQFFFSLIVAVVLALCSADARAKAEDRKEGGSREAKETAVRAPEEKALDSAEKGAGEDRKDARSADAKGLPGKDYKLDDFKPVVEEESSVWMLFKTILVLGLLAGGFYYFFRFITKKAGIQVLGTEAIHVLSVVPLGQNKYLQVVDLAGRVLVLGVSDSGIRLISEIKEKDEIDRIRILSSRTPPPGDGNFHDYLVKQVGWLINRLSEKKGKPKEFRDAGPDLSFLKNQKKRLRNLNGDNE